MQLQFVRLKSSSDNYTVNCLSIFVGAVSFIRCAFPSAVGRLSGEVGGGLRVPSEDPETGGGASALPFARSVHPLQVPPTQAACPLPQVSGGSSIRQAELGAG